MTHRSPRILLYLCVILLIGCSAPPLHTPSPPSSLPPDDEIAQLNAVHRPARDMVDLARAFRGEHDIAPVARTTPLEVQLGDIERFWVVNIHDNTNYRVTAELRYIGPVVLMYVEQGVSVDQSALERAAHTFEQEIYPRTREMFGSEWIPGVDGDPRITILNGRGTSGGLIGYFSSRDSLPHRVNRFSNERDMFYMNIQALNPDSPSYLDTLSHEFQHMIHWHEQPRAAIWFNEGCSTLAQEINGYGTQHYASNYLSRPDTQLTAWRDSPLHAMAHYGAANLFLRYLAHHYVGEEGLVPLIRADAGHHTEALVTLAQQTHPDIDSMGTLFATWALANLLNDPALADGRYAYAPDGLPHTIRPQQMSGNTIDSTLAQFGAAYWQMPPGPATLVFSGTTEIDLVGAMPHDTMAWWSGRGDGSMATLTRPVDLRGHETATLRAALWYEIEEGYDYAFVSVSADGGETWDILPGEHTSEDDPQGMNYGHGLTGISGISVDTPTQNPPRGEWIEEEIDLSPYAGQEVLLRFWQINDEGYNSPGLLIDNIHIPELDYFDDVEMGEGDWEAEGFVRVDGRLPQLWHVYLVRTAADGATTIERLMVDEAGQVSAPLHVDEETVLMIAPTTPHTTERAHYHITIAP